MASNNADLPKCGLLECGWIVFGSATRPLGKEHAEVSIACSLQSENPITIDELSYAWRALGTEYPNLRAIPVNFCKQHVDVDEWTSKTFKVEPNSGSAELMPKVPPRDLPGLWWLPSTSEILFVAQHWRIDGVGAIMIVGRLLEILSQGKNMLVQPPEVPSLVLEDASGADAFDNTERQAWGVKQAGDFHDVMFSRGNLPFEGDQSTLPGGIGQYGVVLSEASTRAITSGCKAKGITVTAAVNFALAQMVFATSTSDDVREDCRIMISADPRPHLTAPHNSRASACNVYVLGSVGIVPRTSTFEDSTRAVTAQLKGWFSEEFRKSLRWFFASVSTEPPATPPSGVYLSNLGIIEKHLQREYGSLQVKAFHLGTATMTRQMTFHIWTFRDRLVLSLNYNCKYHTLATVKKRLNIIQEELGKGLGVRIEANEAMVLGYSQSEIS